MRTQALQEKNDFGCAVKQVLTKLEVQTRVRLLTPNFDTSQRLRFCLHYLLLSGYFFIAIHCGSPLFYFVCLNLIGSFVRALNLLEIDHRRCNFFLSFPA